MVYTYPSGIHYDNQWHMAGEDVVTGNSIDVSYMSSPFGTKIVSGDTGGTRNGYIYNLGPSDIFLMRGDNYEGMTPYFGINKGIRLQAGHAWKMASKVDKFQGAIYAVSSVPSQVRIAIQQS